MGNHVKYTIHWENPEFHLHPRENFKYCQHRQLFKLKDDILEQVKPNQIGDLENKQTNTNLLIHQNREQKHKKTERSPKVKSTDASFEAFMASEPGRPRLKLTGLSPGNKKKKKICRA